MMMSDKKKGITTVILGKLSGKPQAPAQPEMEKSESEQEVDPMQAAAEEVMQAIEQKDVGALQQALTSMFSIHCDREEAEPEAPEME